ncbi:hypothetical protein AALP_AA5G208300 [Arabis alpina]|uniref:F-box domain-containing protein n=1 Tax=Arabis alpina TaxID=50452 RepID=A0A087GYE9_ARAAL|nr:hypothetical protein AALP_AA5G208300 [Arabis alpina]
MGSRRNWKLGSSKNKKKTKKKKKTKRAKRKNQTFLDLPSDLLQLIISLLPLKDNIRASTVCKKLQEACVSGRVVDKTPWLIYFSKIDDGSYELYDPSMQKKQLLFFNPFTRDRIPVPSLGMAYDQRMAFSCAPTSTSCLLFTVSNVTLNNYITVKTCSPNAKEWTSYVFRERLPPNYNNIEQIVFANGRPPRHPGSNGCFMTEHQGKMFLVYMYNHMNPTVLKLDDTSLEWTEIKTLGGLTIYASALCSESRAEQNQPSVLHHGIKKVLEAWIVKEEEED